MRKSSIATDASRQPATKRSKPTAQAEEPAACRPANWLQLSLGLKK